MSYPIRNRVTPAGGMSGPSPAYSRNAPSSAYASSSRPTYSTPTRSNPPIPSTTKYRPTQPQIYHHPPTYSPGPLPFFLPPPGQPTTDPTLSTPPTSQALRSTYSSRLRTGVTGLVQPENITGGPREREYFLAELDRELANARSGSRASTPRYDSPAGRRAPPTTLSGRQTGRGGAVNYAEDGSEDEEEEEEIVEAASDPEDTDYGGGGRKRRRGGGGGDYGGAGGRGNLSNEYQVAMRARKLRKKKDELDRGWTWLGDRVPGDRVRSTIVRSTKHQYVSEEMLEREAHKAEALVPISVDFDVPANHQDQVGIKIRDRFLWNVNERFITPYQFSAIFCEDLGIPLQPYANTMSDLIQGQLDEAQNAVEIDITDTQVTEDDVVFDDEEVEVDALDDDREKAWDEADCRIIVNLDVQIYTHILRDRIEWDLSSPLPPSAFATKYCTELGLTGEAIPLVAHAIQDELLKHKRDALELELFGISHPDEQAKWDKSAGGGPKVNYWNGAKGLVGVWRDWWDREEYGPVLVELSTEEMERREMERTREARRMMRTLTTSKRRR